VQIFLKDGEGNSLENPIIIDAQDAITGLTLEYGYIDEIINCLDGAERELLFDISAFFGKI
jgi:hypothetical protein